VSLPARIVTLLVAFLAVAAGVAFLVVHYLLGTPPTVDYTAGVTADTGATVNVVMQEDPQNTVSAHPDWVSYFIQDPSTHQWVHTTLFKVPAGSKINMTILGYDGCTPLRNNYWSQVQGTIGGTVNLSVVNNKGVATPPRNVSVINSWAGCTVGHTFAIPALHLFVPVASPNAIDSVNNLCGVSPCTSGPHAVETFSFKAPDHGGIFRWQCLVPCGGGYIDGNGGPMQTIGFMTGNMEVRA
jgi:hypothetical protein